MLLLILKSILKRLKDSGELLDGLNFDMIFSDLKDSYGNISGKGTVVISVKQNDPGVPSLNENKTVQFNDYEFEFDLIIYVPENTETPFFSETAFLLHDQCMNALINWCPGAKFKCGSIYQNGSAVFKSKQEGIFAVEIPCAVNITNPYGNQNAE